MMWWNDPRLDDEGTYDYLVEELPQNHSEWSRFPTVCNDCGKHTKLHKTDYSYFYCWDGWDSMEYTVCWKCHVKRTVRSWFSKCKKAILNHCRKLNIGAYIVFRKFCKKHNVSKEQRAHLWTSCYDYWSDKANYKLMKGLL